MEIAFLLFDGITHLDAVGPYAVLQNLPDANVKFVAKEKRTYRDRSGMLGVAADFTLDQVSAPNILVVPGGGGADAAAEDSAITDWVNACHANTRWTTSVCTGALILGGAGVLRGLPATTHWRAMRVLEEEYGAKPTTERVVRDGKVITAAGVSSGIDMALTLAALEAGEEIAKTIQLGIEYAPEPPFDAGRIGTAPPERVDRWRAGLNKTKR